MAATPLWLSMSPVGVRNVRLNDWLTSRVSESRNRVVTAKSPKALWRVPSDPRLETMKGICHSTSNRRLNGVKRLRLPVYASPPSPWTQLKGTLARREKTPLKALSQLCLRAPPPPLGRPIQGPSHPSL